MHAHLPCYPLSLGSDIRRDACSARRSVNLCRPVYPLTPLQLDRPPSPPRARDRLLGTARAPRRTGRDLFLLLVHDARAFLGFVRGECGKSCPAHPASPLQLAKTANKTMEVRFLRSGQHNRSNPLLASGRIQGNWSSEHLLKRDQALRRRHSCMRLLYHSIVGMFGVWSGIGWNCDSFNDKGVGRAPSTFSGLPDVEGKKEKK